MDLREYEKKYEKKPRSIRADTMYSRCKKRHYYLEGGFIRPIKDSPPVDYNPFDFYINGDKDKDSLHRQFANIDLSNEDEILGFYNKYGSLGLFQSKYSNIVTLPDYEIKNYNLSSVYITNKTSSSLVPIGDVINTYKIDEDIIPQIDENGDFKDKDGYLVTFNVDACYTSEEIEEFKKFCNEFRIILDLKFALENKDYEDIKRLLVLYSKGCKDDIENNNEEKLLSSASTAIIITMIEYIEGMVNPLLQWNSQGTGISKDITWRCKTLLSSIYMMLFMDITSGNLTKKCKNIKCKNKYFEANKSKKTNVYCSDKCRISDNVRKLREKK